jgi:hypothetical protein
MEERYFPVVVQALAGSDYTVYAYFTDGTIHLFDVKPLIANGGVFERLTEGSFFTDKLTVMNSTVAWDLSGCYDPSNCIDIDPFVIYESERVEDPIGEIA